MQYFSGLLQNMDPQRKILVPGLVGPIKPTSLVAHQQNNPVPSASAIPSCVFIGHSRLMNIMALQMRALYTSLHRIQQKCTMGGVKVHVCTISLLGWEIKIVVKHCEKWKFDKCVFWQKIGESKFWAKARKGFWFNICIDWNSNEWLLEFYVKVKWGTMVQANIFTRNGWLIH